MNRREFIKLLSGITAAVSLGLEFLPGNLKAQRFESLKYDPVEYMGDWEWISIGGPAGRYFEDYFVNEAAS